MNKLSNVTVRKLGLGSPTAPDFIKIDIEGWEIEVLKGARETLTTYRPALFLEMHGATMNEKRRKASEIVGWLEEAGYDHIRHVETGTEITSANASLAAQGHLHCPKPTAASNLTPRSFAAAPGVRR